VIYFIEQKKGTMMKMGLISTNFSAWRCLVQVLVVGLLCAARQANAYDVIISSGASSGGIWSGGNPDVWTPNAAASNVSTADIQSRIATGGVSISADKNGAENGDIFVNDAIVWNANTALTLSAYRNLNVNANITATGNTAGLNLISGMGGAGGSVYFGAGVNLSASSICSYMCSGNGSGSGGLVGINNGAVINPTGVNLVAGSGAIFTSGTAMTINQSTQNAVIDWNAFNASNYSIGGNLAMNFALPNISAVTLNLVSTTNPGLILGQLTANGTVYAINPSGVIFGTSSILDTSALATSATSPINVVSLGISANMQVNSGWNLLGNSTDTPLNVATAMGDANKVNTVWKWNPTTNNWAFYTPAQADGGAAYAAAKGYEFLISVNSGEGFWVNAKIPFVFALPIGNLLPAATAQTPPSPGWSMVSVGNNITPSLFNTALSPTSPATGITPVNLTSLWAWDNSQSNWFFYAPSLEAQGGTALADYSSAKGYRDFNAANKTLGPGMGFWVNKP
jgi:filamentous hemagglutinin family protein